MLLAGGEEGHTNAGGSQPEVMKRNAQSISGGLGSQRVGEEAGRAAPPPSPPPSSPKPPPPPPLSYQRRPNSLRCS